MTTVPPLKPMPVEFYNSEIGALKTGKVGIIFPTTVKHIGLMEHIVRTLVDATFIDVVLIVINNTTSSDDYMQMVRIAEPLGERAHIQWLESDAEAFRTLNESLSEFSFPIDVAGKGRAVWYALGYMLGIPDMNAFVMFDADNQHFDESLPARLLFPLVMGYPEYHYVKASYARFDEQLRGRVVRYGTTPLLTSLIKMQRGPEDLLDYIDKFEYPLSGEMGWSRSLCRLMTVPCNWSIEIHTLFEVFAHCSRKHIAQVDIGVDDHQHQELDPDGDGKRGLVGMFDQICLSVFSNLAASRQMVFGRDELETLCRTFAKEARDLMPNYRTIARMHGLKFDGARELEMIEKFSKSLWSAGQQFLQGKGSDSILPPWAHVNDVVPGATRMVHEAVTQDREKYALSRVTA